MSTYVQNPNRLTKEQLRQYLLKHNVTLPSPESRKQVFIDLYRKHILKEKEIVDLNFSSEDDEEAVSVKNRKVYSIFYMFYFELLIFKFKLYFIGLVGLIKSMSPKQRHTSRGCTSQQSILANTGDLADTTSRR